MFVSKQYYDRFKRNLSSKQNYVSQKRNIKDFNQNDQFYHNKNHVYQFLSQMFRNDCSFRVEIIIKMKNSQESSSERDFSKNRINTNDIYDRNKQKDKNNRQKKN